MTGRKQKRTRGRVPVSQSRRATPVTTVRGSQARVVPPPALSPEEVVTPVVLADEERSQARVVPPPALSPEEVVTSVVLADEEQDEYLPNEPGDTSPDVWSTLLSLQDKLGGAHHRMDTFEIMLAENNSLLVQIRDEARRRQPPPPQERPVQNRSGVLRTPSVAQTRLPRPQALSTPLPLDFVPEKISSNRSPALSSSTPSPVVLSTGPPPTVVPPPALSPEEVVTPVVLADEEQDEYLPNEPGDTSPDVWSTLLSLQDKLGGAHHRMDTFEIMLAENNSLLVQIRDEARRRQLPPPQERPVQNRSGVLRTPSVAQTRLPRPQALSTPLPLDFVPEKISSNRSPALSSSTPSPVVLSTGPPPTGNPPSVPSVPETGRLPLWLVQARAKYSQQKLPSISEIEKLAYQPLKKHPSNTDLRRWLLAVDWRHAAFASSAEIPLDQFINSLRFGE
ncbi:histone-lysine N-methyltransferase MLL2 isoform 3, partial [Planoprotostelium fungivorum]